jgi:HTH-type transcriptional regulator / antitoxin HigA
MKYWMVLETKREYDLAMHRIGELLDANPPKGSETGKELKLLLCLVEKYEDEHYPIGLPDPIEAIKSRMEDLRLEPKDLIAAVGDKGTVSKVLNKKIPLSLRMIRNLTQLLQLPADVLIQEAKLAAA